MRWQTSALKKYFVEVYCQVHDTAKPAPAMQSPAKLRAASREQEREGNAREPYTRVHPQVAWDIMEQSRSTYTSVRQVLDVRRDDAHTGCGPQLGEVWVNKLLTIYQERRRHTFGSQVNHINLASDPATHSKKEAMVSVAWSWESEAGAYADFQWMPQSKTMTPDGAGMPEHIFALAATDRLERLSTFRQLQAYSNTVAQLTDNRLANLDAFSVPELACTRLVRDNEVRILERIGPAASRAYIVDRDRPGLRQEVLPDSIQEVPLLILNLDQGSVGTAGVAYTNDREKLIHPKWCKFHRVVRDIRLSATHASGGIFLKAQLYSGFLGGINYKSFGCGLNGTEKRWLLNVFLATNSVDGELFQKYGERVAQDFMMPFHTPSQQEAVWRCLSSIMSFTQPLQEMKLGRWFSWNAAAHKQMRDGPGVAIASAGRR